MSQIVNTRKMRRTRARLDTEARIRRKTGTRPFLYYGEGLQIPRNAVKKPRARVRRLMRELNRYFESGVEVPGMKIGKKKSVRGCENIYL